MPIEIIPDELVSELIVLAIIGGVAWLTGMYHCVRKQGKRGWRQSQAISFIAQAEDDIMTSQHSDVVGAGKLFKKVDKMLKDDKGNY